MRPWQMVFAFVIGLLLVSYGDSHSQAQQTALMGKCKQLSRTDSVQALRWIREASLKDPERGLIWRNNPSSLPPRHHVFELELLIARAPTVYSNARDAWAVLPLGNGKSFCDSAAKPSSESCQLREATVSPRLECLDGQQADSCEWFVPDGVCGSFLHLD